MIGAMSLWGGAHPDVPAYIRPAKAEDARDVLRLRNDPESVFWSGGAPIQEETHQEWFRTHCSSIRILSIGESVQGYARVADDGRVSFAVRDSVRGQGWGRRLLEAIEDLARQNGLTVLYALVHPSNIASMRAFMHAGYALSSPAGIFQKVIKAL